MKDGKRVRKSNRLRFKTQKNMKVEVPKLKKNISPTISPEPEQESEHLPKEQPPNLRNTNSFNDPNEFIEWGPFINGYRFVGAKDGKPLQFKKRHTLVNEDYRKSDTYNWSYMELPSFKSSSDTLEEKYGKNGTAADEFGYDEYFKEWEYIKENGLRDIVFPVPHQDYDELNKGNVQNFLQSSNEEYFNVLKIERIRWHPDKMIRTLKLDVNDKMYKELSDKITKTFQIINQLWEEYNNK